MLFMSYEKQIQRTGVLEAQPFVEWSNEGILHGGQTACSTKAPNNSSFPGEAGKVVQQFCTPQDHRVTGGGVPQLAGNASPQLQQLAAMAAQQLQQQGVDGPPSCLPARHSTHALADYQMQLMLLEKQNKKRLMMARLDVDAAELRDAACAQVGKSNLLNIDGPPKPQMGQRIDPPSCQQNNQVAGAGIVPAAVRDV